MDIGEIIGEVAAPVSIPTKSAIYVWGYNQSGQTGRKGQESLLRIPKQLPPELFGCPAAGANSRWLDISCGREHTAAVASDGSLFTWGIALSFHKRTLLFLFDTKLFPFCSLWILWLNLRQCVLSLSRCG